MTSNNYNRKHLAKRIFESEYCGFYGCKWVAYNGKCGYGFWQQVTKYYKSIKNLKRFNKEFNDEHIKF